MIVDALAEYLADFGAVTSYAQDRIYRDYLPQSLDLRSNSPTVSLFLVDNVYSHTLDGVVTTITARVQVDTWSYAKYEVVALANTIKHILDGVQHTNLGNTRIAWCRLLDERDLNEAPEDGSTDWLFRRMQDYQVEYVCVQACSLATAEGGLVLSGEDIA